MAKKGAMRRDPKYTTQPVKDGNGRTAGNSDVLGDTKGARRAAERAARRAPVERLSPGVYRSASGDLVGQGGRPIQRRPQAPQQPQMPAPMQSQPGQVGQAVADQVNKPFDMSQLQNGIYWNPNFNPESIGKTPPGWSGGGNYDPSLNQGPMQNLVYRMPQGMPQMPQASANMGGQYRLSPGVYGTRDQAMQQYNQQMQDMMAQYRMPSVPQQRRG